MVLGLKYKRAIGTLSKRFKYITQREGYNLEDTWIFHAGEIIEGLTNSEFSDVTQDGYLRAIKATIYYLYGTPKVKKDTTVLYEDYHKIIRGRIIKTKRQD